MEEIEKYNYNLIKNDIESLYKIYKEIMNEKDIDVLIMGWLPYFIFIVLEVSKYLNGCIELKYKRILSKIRGKIKPYEQKYDEIVQDMATLNAKEMEEYKGYVRKGFKTILSCFIPNYGVYKKDGEIIGNIFLYKTIYKRMINENGKYSKTKIVEISKEIGMILIELAREFDIELDYKGKSRNINIEIKDYNVLKRNCKLFRKGINNNDGLLLLNSLSLINFYIYIMSDVNINRELKYRLGYIIFDNTYKNVLKIIEGTGKEIIIKDIKKYDFLINSQFRNCMYHYNIVWNLAENEIKDEMYMGIISKYLKINENEYIELINEYMNVLASILKDNIFI